MKKRYYTMAAVVVISGSVLLSSCIGSFTASNKILAWNKTVGDKFVNELVFVALVIIPVYPIALLADAVVLNSIEFWSGENPMEAGVVTKVQGENETYTVETLKDGYHIENGKGEELDLIYDKETSTWNSVSDGEKNKILKIENDKQAIVYLPNGQEMNVDLSTEGVLAFRQAIERSTYFAEK